MGKTITLCVDDEPVVLNAIRTLLTNQLDNNHIIEIAESAEEALEICEDLLANGDELNLIISDYIMPDMQGDELLARIHAISPNTITILLTGQSFIEGVKRAINNANLYRFLEKPFNNDDIVLTVRGAHLVYAQARELERQNESLRLMNANLEALVEQRTHELREKNQELERIAATDRLTGVYNRLRLDQIQEKELAYAERYGVAFSLLLLDVDQFKSINDQFGHRTGDMVLIDLARVLGENIRKTDTLGRWGGEEFLIICPNTQIDNAQQMAEHIRQKVQEHAFAEIGHKTVSVGVACYRSGDSIVTIMERADGALYRAKGGGRNRVEVEDGDTDSVLHIVSA